MAVAVTEAAIVLMFSKKKDDVEEVFLCVGCRIFGQSGTLAIFL